MERPASRSARRSGVAMVDILTPQSGRNTNATGRRRCQQRLKPPTSSAARPSRWWRWSCGRGRSSRWECGPRWRPTAVKSLRTCNRSGTGSGDVARACCEAPSFGALHNSTSGSLVGTKNGADGAADGTDQQDLSGEACPLRRRSSRSKRRDLPTSRGLGPASCGRRTSTPLRRELTLGVRKSEAANSPDAAEAADYGACRPSSRFIVEAVG